MGPWVLTCLAPLWLAAAPAAPTAAVWLGLPDSREERIVDPAFGGHVYVYEAGLGKPRSVVLVHGLGEGGAHDWEKLIPVLAASYHVVTFDLPGFGRSDKGNELYSPASQAAFVAHVVAAKVRGPYALVGHSAGASAALRYASQPRAGLEQVVAIDAAGMLHRQVYLAQMVQSASRRNHWTSLGRLLATVLRSGPASPIELDAILASKALRGSLLGGNPITIAGAALLADDFSPLLPRVEVPVLLIWGARDEIAPLRTGKAMLNILPRARLEVLEGLGHEPHNEAPERFNPLLLAALAGTAPGPGAAVPAAPAPAGIGAPTDARPPERVARCQRKRDFRLEGEWDRVLLRGCRGAVLRGVRARTLEVTSSTVEIESSEFVSARGPALRARGAQITVTGGRLAGEVAIEVRGSRLDLAGVKLEGRQELVRGDNGEFLFSFCSGKTAHGGLSLHGPRSVEPRRPLR